MRYVRQTQSKIGFTKDAIEFSLTNNECSFAFKFNRIDFDKIEAYLEEHLSYTPVLVIYSNMECKKFWGAIALWPGFEDFWNKSINHDNPFSDTYCYWLIKDKQQPISDIIDKLTADAFNVKSILKSNV